jgi:GTP-binding protein HflX
LFNRLTQADVFAKDLLFATLDPTLRALKLPHGGKVILSDTVGFISDLPTMLVSAFRATLEEVIAADVILHVRDIAHEDTSAQSTDVETILGDLGVDAKDPRRVIEVWNKLDLLSDDARLAFENNAQLKAPLERPQIVSAVTGEGLDALLGAIEDRLAQDRQTLRVSLDAADGQGLHWLYENAEVLGRNEVEDRIDLTLRVTPERLDRLTNRFPDAQILTNA